MVGGRGWNRLARSWRGGEGERSGSLGDEVSVFSDALTKVFLDRLDRGKRMYAIVWFGIMLAYEEMRCVFFRAVLL